MRPFSARIAVESGVSDAGFAEIIPSCPNKVADDPGVCEHRLPILECLSGIRLSSHNDPRRKFLMVWGVLPPLVVVATNIEKRKRRLRRRPGTPVPGGANGFRHRTSGVEAANLVAQLFLDDVTAFADALRNFVADAPHADTRMIAVAP